MFLGIFAIDEYVNIPAVTHRFSSGAAYAPMAITYSIYEEGNTTGLDENIDMTPASPFDAIVGCYLARRQLTAAAGFENNKTYVVVVKATVDSVAAIDVHVFQVRPQQTGDSYAVVNSASKGLVKVYDDMSKPGTAQTITAPADMALNSTVAKAADIPSTSSIADAVHDEVVEGTLTLRKIIRLLLSIMAGKSTGGGTATIKFRDNADAKDRISATVDTSGNRTVITLDGD